MTSSRLKAGFGRIKITPDRSTQLAGYFNERPSRGVLSDLYVRCCLLEDRGEQLALLTADVVCLSYEDCHAIQGRIAEAGGPLAPNVLVAATHTHTAPATVGLFDVQREDAFVEQLIRSAAEVFSEARSNLRPAHPSFGLDRNETLAFCRRYVMKDGTVVTNPGKGNPEILRSEGPVDPDVAVLAVQGDDGEFLGLVVNATNHADTIGGDLVSPDWPGYLEENLQRQLQRPDLPVILLNGFAGNINHFDVSNQDPQTSEKEGRRIAGGYAETVLSALDALRPGSSSPLRASMEVLALPARMPTEKEVVEARDQLREIGPATRGDLTSEGLAQGDSTILRIFAEETLACLDRGALDLQVPLQAMRFGDLALIGFPGEPFSEIALALKERSPFPYTFLVGLANGSFGYIPLREHFERPSYETLTHRYNLLPRDAGQRFIEIALRLLGRLAA